MLLDTKQLILEMEVPMDYKVKHTTICSPTS